VSFSKLEFPACKNLLNASNHFPLRPEVRISHSGILLSHLDVLNCCHQIVKSADRPIELWESPTVKSAGKTFKIFCFALRVGCLQSVLCTILPLLSTSVRLYLESGKDLQRLAKRIINRFKPNPY